jgi:hypothetical protein
VSITPGILTRNYLHAQPHFWPESGRLQRQQAEWDGDEYRYQQQRKRQPVDAHPSPRHRTQRALVVGRTLEISQREGGHVVVVGRDVPWCATGVDRVGWRHEGAPGGGLTDDNDPAAAAI